MKIDGRWTHMGFLKEMFKKAEKDDFMD